MKVAKALRRKSALERRRAELRYWKTAKPESIPAYKLGKPGWKLLSLGYISQKDCIKEIEKIVEIKIKICMKDIEQLEK